MEMFKATPSNSGFNVVKTPKGKTSEYLVYSTGTALAMVLSLLVSPSFKDNWYNIAHAAISVWSNSPEINKVY